MTGDTVPGRSYVPAPSDAGAYTVRAQAQTSGATVPRRILSASQRMRAIQMPTIPAPLATTSRTPSLPRRPAPKQSGMSAGNWLLLAIFSGVALAGTSVIALGLGALIVFSSGILPGVSAAGVDLGGMSPAEAEAALVESWSTLTLRDGDRTWRVSTGGIGIHLDAAATAERAYAQGRGDGSPFAAIFGSVDVAPVVQIDRPTLRASLETLTARVEIAPVNAGIRLIDGEIRASEPANGRALNIDATMATLDNGLETLADGRLDLVMTNVQPTVIDAAPLVEAARQILTNPLVVTVYDPVTDDRVEWAAMPETWARWLTGEPDADSPGGLRLTLNEVAASDWLVEQSAVFDETRYLRLDEVVADLKSSLRNGGTRALARVYHHDRQHVVRAGETITSIAWNYGVPYPWLQRANPGMNSLSTGQTITIPSPDNFMPYDVVPDKRIVVSISQQRTRVYENGALLWDWATSTGISDSPTWPGIYQIISHYPNAYAGNWNLWMPHFLGVYQPIPGADFTNGFHGFPTRGGGQLLWENNLGSRVTYGCILLSSANAQLLYNWADTGVVVEILP